VRTCAAAFAAGAGVATAVVVAAAGFLDGAGVSKAAWLFVIGADKRDVRAGAGAAVALAGACTGVEGTVEVDGRREARDGRDTGDTAEPPEPVLVTLPVVEPKLLGGFTSFDRAALVADVPASRNKLFRFSRSIPSLSRTAAEAVGGLGSIIACP
jgi:hypothetical protein